MGMFGPNEDDAIREINKINSKMQEIRTQLVLYGDCINSNNRKKIRELIESCEEYARKYDKIKSKMDEFEVSMFYGAKVNCWNGETVGPLQWEQYFRNIYNAIIKEVR